MLKKSKPKFPYNPVISSLGKYLREVKTYVNINNCAQMFRSALFVRVPSWKQSDCPSTDKWTFTQATLLSRKTENIPHRAAVRMNFKHMMLSERSQTQKTSYS